MKSIISIYITVIFLSVVVSSCKKNNEEEEPQVLNSISLNQAKLLFITNDGNSSYSLYKVKSDETVEKVNMLNTKGNVLSNNGGPSVISNGNSNFLLMGFNTSSGYLVKKSDGSVQILDYVPYPVYAGLMNNPTSHVDASLNIYYRGVTASGSQRIVKINTVNPNLISVSTINSEGETFDDFDIDFWGNVVYEGSRISPYTAINRIIKSNGGIVNLPSNVNNNEFFIAEDGNICYAQANDGKLYKATYNESLDSYTFNVYVATSTISHPYRRYLYKYIYSGNTILISTDNDGMSAIKNSDSTMMSVKPASINDIKLVGMSYLSGVMYIVSANNSSQQNIYKVDLNNSYSTTSVLTDGKYEFTDMEVFEDGTVYFVAQRMSDSKYVIVKVSSTGTETLLDETINKPAIQLEKVSEFIPE